MTESKICTCPSGDGSLRWPCPAHPAVEQAVGDERAAFEAAFAAMGRPVCRADYDQDAYGTPFDDGGWTGWQARAALAQPSPAQAEQHWPKLEKPAQVGGVRFSAGVSSRLVVEAAQRLYEFESTPEQEAERIERLQAFREQCFEPLGAEFSKVLSDNLPELLSTAQSEQAEAERPEVAEVAFVLRNIGAMDAEDIDGDNVDLRFEDAEGRDTGCDVSIVEYAEKAADLFEQHDRIVGTLRAENAKLSEALDECDGDRWKLRSERDSALARVAELETKLAELEKQEPAGWLAYHFGGKRQGTVYGGPCDTKEEIERYIQQVERSDDSITLQGKPFYAAPAAQAQHSVPEGLAEFSQFLSAVMDAAGLVRYGRRSKELSEYLGAQCMKYRLSAPVAQAQHSGPEEFSFEYRHPNGESHTVTVSRDQVISEMPDFLLEALCSKFCNCEPVGETNVVECCCDEYAEEFKLLAAAPGKEVPQAWLDVQAERRRQVEVEGYHGFRDNHYISYELSKAARAYIEVSWHALSGGLPCKKPESWPWMAGFKWSDGRTMLVKAGALILAEIERLDRAAPGKEVGHE